MHFTRSYKLVTIIGFYNSSRVCNKILRSTSVGSQYYSAWVKSLEKTSTTNSPSWLGGYIQLTWKLAYFDNWKKYLSRISSSVIQKKRIQVKRTLVKAWIQFIEESCIYLFIFYYLATTELRPQSRRTTAPFITNCDSKLPNQTIADLRLLSSPLGCRWLSSSPLG